MQTSLYRLAPRIRITEEQLNAVEGWARFYVVYLFELRQKFPRNVFHVDHLLNEESGGPRAKEIEDLKDRGERCIFSLRFGFSLAHHFPLSTHTYFFSCLQYLHFLLKHVCQAITSVTWLFLEKAIYLSSCIDDFIFYVRSIWRPL